MNINTILLLAVIIFILLSVYRFYSTSRELTSTFVENYQNKKKNIKCFADMKKVKEVQDCIYNPNFPTLCIEGPRIEAINSQYLIKDNNKIGDNQPLLGDYKYFGQNGSPETGHAKLNSSLSGLYKDNTPVICTDNNQNIMSDCCYGSNFKSIIITAEQTKKLPVNANITSWGGDTNTCVYPGGWPFKSGV